MDVDTPDWVIDWGHR